jgi:hypothetical protein
MSDNPQPSLPVASPVQAVGSKVKNHPRNLRAFVSIPGMPMPISVISVTIFYAVSEIWKKRRLYG